ncbi:hypothetical protein IV203_030127 [Nitzschia inconspicua]|uniref:Uncharacterized protein n=1 Tax=Nitzschia inconspicua TaxID=303405 RepID=A0A9K3LVI9_9STRA|nr:hypothetical protein IV203_030127 [Nitzschia inconspicua]
MAIVDDIRSNSISTLHLSEAPEDYFAEIKTFVDAMAANTSIEKVIFDKDFLSCAVGTERADIVSSLSKLGNVKSVILRDSLLNTGVCVTNLAKNSKTLEELVMENCLLQGTPNDFKLLENAINGSPSFKNLRIHDCTAPNDQVNLANVMESLQEGLNIDVSGDGNKA